MGEETMNCRTMDQLKRITATGIVENLGFLFLLVVFVYFYQCFASCFNILRGPCVESIISPRTSFHGRLNRYNNHRRGLVLLLVLSWVEQQEAEVLQQ